MISGENRRVRSRLPIWRTLSLEFRLSLNCSIRQPGPRRSWERSRFRFPLLLPPLNGRRAERRGWLPGAAAEPCPSAAPEPAVPHRARLSAPARGQSPARTGFAGARCRRPAPLAPWRWPCHRSSVSRCLQRGLAALNGSAEHHGQCPHGVRRRREAGAALLP